jgi:hypothetical protein
LENGKVRLGGGKKIDPDFADFEPPEGRAARSLADAIGI